MLGGGAREWDDGREENKPEKGKGNVCLSNITSLK